LDEILNLEDEIIVLEKKQFEKCFGLFHDFQTFRSVI